MIFYKIAPLNSRIKNIFKAPFLQGIVFWFAVLGYLLIFYPGLMSDDSYTMYALAVEGKFSQHTSVFLIWLWKQLNRVYSGPLLMFLFNMGLLWGSIHILAFRLVVCTWARYLALLFPYTFWMLLYSGYIWKDVFLAFGYMFLVVHLLEKEKMQQRFSFFQWVLFWVLLICSTEVKFVQTRFICPLVIFWFLQVQWPLWSGLKRVTITGMLSGILIFGTHSFHKKVFSNPSYSTHSWQFVTIYDLVGMSVYSGTYLVPEFLVLRPGLHRLRESYDLLWDPLICYPNSPLRKTQSDMERSILVKSWNQAVIRHPLSYLQHRSRVFIKGTFNVFGPLSKRWIALVKKFLWLEKFPWLLYLIRIISGHFLFLPLQIYLGFFYKGPSSVRRINRIGVTFFAVLFIFSLAGVPRYIFLNVVLCLSSLPLVLENYSNRLRKNRMNTGQMHIPF